MVHRDTTLGEDDTVLNTLRGTLELSDLNRNTHIKGTLNTDQE